MFALLAFYADDYLSRPLIVEAEVGLCIVRQRRTGIDWVRDLFDRKRCSQTTVRVSAA